MLVDEAPEVRAECVWEGNGRPSPWDKRAAEELQLALRKSARVVLRFSDGHLFRVHEPTLFTWSVAADFSAARA